MDEFIIKPVGFSKLVSFAWRAVPTEGCAKAEHLLTICFWGVHFINR